MFRVRPLNELRLLSIVHYGMDNSNWKQLSSFPSDHAALFFTLAVGIYFASRRPGWFCFIYYSLQFICLPPRLPGRALFDGHRRGCGNRDGPRRGWPIYPASESRSPVGLCDGWTQIHRSFIVLPSLSPIKSRSSSTPPLSCCVSSFFIVSAESPISRIPSNFPLIQSSDRLTLPKPGSHGPGLGQIHHYQPRGGLPNAGCARRRHSPASTGCTA